MRYRLLKPYPVFDVTNGDPLTTEVCARCGRPIRLGETRLGIAFVDDPPYPDAIGAMEGPEWAVSQRLESFLRELAIEEVEFIPLSLEDATPSEFSQVVVFATLPAGQSSIRAGDPCAVCGQGGQLNGGPIFLRREMDDGPKIARLLENPFVVLVREDIAAAISDACDLDWEPVFFDGETPPHATQTFEGVDWSDL